MNMLKNIPLCLLCLLFSNCDRQKQKEGDLPVIERYTDNKANLSDLFDEVTVVPLETDPDGLVGLGAWRIEVFDEKIFLLNQTYSHHNILCFDSSGGFLFKIDKLGKGENEYTFLNDFFIDENRKEIVLDTESGRFFRFDLSGEFVGETWTKDVYYGRHISLLNDSVLVMLNDQTVLPEGIDLMTIDANTFDIKEQSPARSILSGYLTPILPISVYHENVLFYDSTDTIFDVSDILDRRPKYVVDMGDEQRKSQEIILKEIETNTYEGFLKIASELFVEKKHVLGKALFENDRYIVVGYAEQSDKSEDRLARRADIGGIGLYIHALGGRENAGRL